MVCEQIINDFFEKINESNISYILIKNIGNELPSNLADGKDIDILVNEVDVQKFSMFMESIGFIKQTCPYGRENGWQFLYGLREYDFWKHKECEQNFYVDASFALACKSIMPNTWIPLDKSIQEYLWCNKKWDSKNNWWILDVNTRFVYYIVRSVFDKKIFNSLYISEIEKEINSIDEDIVVDMMRKIFFKATDCVWNNIKAKKYDCIIHDYLTFSEY